MIKTTAFHGLVFKKTGEIEYFGEIYGTWEKIDHWKKYQCDKGFHKGYYCGNKIVHFTWIIKLKNGKTFDFLYTLFEAKQRACIEIGKIIFK